MARTFLKTGALVITAVFLLINLSLAQAPSQLAAPSNSSYLEEWQNLLLRFWQTLTFNKLAKARLDLQDSQKKFDRLLTVLRDGPGAKLSSNLAGYQKSQRRLIENLNSLSRNPDQNFFDLTSVVRQTFSRQKEQLDNLAQSQSLDKQLVTFVQALADGLQAQIKVLEEWNQAGSAVLSQVAVSNLPRLIDFQRGGQSLGRGGVEVYFKNVSGETATKILNVYADLNGDGQYQTDEWLVQNEPAVILASEDGATSHTFYFSRGLKNRGTYPVAVNLSDSILEKPAVSSGGWLVGRAESVSWDFDKFFKFDPNYLTGSVPTVFGLPRAEAQVKKSPAGIEKSGGKGKKVIYKGQSGTIEYIQYTGVPDLRQGKNECAPLAAANSMLWLAKSNNFENILPAAGKKNQNTTIIKELKEAMDWKVGKGVAAKNFIPGKEAFVKKYNLPVEVHLVAGKELGKDKDVDKMSADDVKKLNDDLSKEISRELTGKILSEMQRGQDIELLVYIEENGKIIGQHAVTLVGLKWFENSASKEKTPLSVITHDSATERTTDEYPVAGNQLLNSPYTRGRARIAAVVAESPIKLPPPPPEAPPIPIPLKAVTKSPDFGLGVGQPFREVEGLKLPPPQVIIKEITRQIQVIPQFIFEVINNLQKTIEQLSPAPEPNQCSLKLLSDADFNGNYLLEYGCSGSFAPCRIKAVYHTLEPSERILARDLKGDGVLSLNIGIAPAISHDILDKNGKECFALPIVAHLFIGGRGPGSGAGDVEVQYGGPL